MTLFYACFKLFMKLTLRIYFRRVRIEGLENVPRNKPLLVTPNHQNAFLDPLLTGAFIPIPLHFLTRSDIFKKWNRPFMKALNMMPIYRIRDGYQTLSKNEAVFESCKELFNDSKSVLIFPEGNHGEHHYLRPLTKGAARIAIQSQLSINEDLMILPVGLNYYNHLAPRSTVRIVFGKPISVSDFHRVYNENEAKGLIALRDAISNGMKDALAIPEEIDDYENRKNTLFKEENSSLSLEELRGLPTDHDATAPPSKRKHIMPRIFNPVPYFIINKVLSKFDDYVFHSSLKFAVGLFVFPIWWLFIFLLLFSLAGIHIATLALIVMVMSLFYSYQ